VRALIPVAVLLAACSPPAPPPEPVPMPGAPLPAPVARLPIGMEAVSFLGDTLRTVPLDYDTRVAYEEQLGDALQAVRAGPQDPDALIWLGRRLAYLGRYREAIAVFGRGVERFPADARFLRHRGHRYISVREPDLAIADLGRAASLTAGQPDALEPDGIPNARGIPTSSLQSNIWYHLGLARYLRGDFPGAASAWSAGLRVAPTVDMTVATTYWLVLAQRRAGRDAEARALLETIRPDMDIVVNGTYHRLLRHFAGTAPLAPEDSATTALDRATAGYGLGAWSLVNGDTVAARSLFQRARAGGNWPAFGYIAAEAELARLNSRRP
jgi:tetratricopeptide (TPR) repeat protein